MAEALAEKTATSSKSPCCWRESASTASKNEVGKFDKAQFADFYLLTSCFLSSLAPLLPLLASFVTVVALNLQHSQIPTTLARLQLTYDQTARHPQMLEWAQKKGESTVLNLGKLIQLITHQHPFSPTILSFLPSTGPMFVALSEPRLWPNHSCA